MKPYYESGGITIYHGDCREVLPGLPQVDLVLTDPPYGVKRDKGFGGFGTPIARRVHVDEWDSDRPSGELLRACVGAGLVAIVWGGNFFADVLPRSTLPLEAVG